MNDFRRSNGLTIPLREGVSNPHSPRCALHLRRVCGVCQHFKGDLRGAGHCGLMNLDLPGRRDARACSHWARRVARKGE